MPILEDHKVIEIPAELLPLAKTLQHVWSTRLAALFQQIILLEGELYLERYGNIPPSHGAFPRRSFEIIEGGKAPAARDE